MITIKMTKEHWQEFEDMQKEMGIVMPDMFFGYSLHEWQGLVEKDQYLNNVPLSRWDKLATERGFGVTHHSLSDGVCVYKHMVLAALKDAGLIEVELCETYQETLK